METVKYISVENIKNWIQNLLKATTKKCKFTIDIICNQIIYYFNSVRITKSFSERLKSLSLSSKQII